MSEKNILNISGLYEAQEQGGIIYEQTGIMPKDIVAKCNELELELKEAREILFAIKENLLSQATGEKPFWDMEWVDKVEKFLNQKERQ